MPRSRVMRAALPPRRLPPTVLPILGVALAYALAVRLAWALPVRSGLVAVWPAAGIALGALLRWGRNLWPGVLIGAFAAKLMTSGALAAVGGAIAPTLEVLICVALLERY